MKTGSPSLWQSAASRGLVPQGLAVPVPRALPIKKVPGVGGMRVLTPAAGPGTGCGQEGFSPDLN